MRIDRPGNLKPLIAAAVALGAVGPSRPLAAQCQYEIVAIIQGPPCADGSGFALPQFLAVNDGGQAVGNYWNCPLGPRRAIEWTAKSDLQLLPLPAGLFESVAYDINESGQIAGTFNPAEPSDQWACVWDAGQFVMLPPPDNVGVSAAFAINEQGQVVGTTSTPDSVSLEACLWNEGVMTIIGPLDEPSSRAGDINDHGEVTGRVGHHVPIEPTARAFVWRDGELTLLPEIPGGLTSSGEAINNRGDVVGAGLVPDDGTGQLFSHTYVRIDGYDQDAGRLLGYFRAAATDINDVCQVVGFCRGTTPTNSVEQGFLWQDDQMHDLADLISWDGHPVDIDRVYAINNQGQILAQAFSFDFLVKAVVLAPVLTSPTDLDFDCRTDLDDLSLLIEAWGRTDSRADYDNNGVVDVDDLVTLLLNWG